jgi:hypothetical protein
MAKKDHEMFCESRRTPDPTIPACSKHRWELCGGMIAEQAQWEMLDGRWLDG